MKEYEILYKEVLCNTYTVQATSKKRALEKFDKMMEEDMDFESPDEICDTDTKILGWRLLDKDEIEDNDWDDEEDEED